MLAPIPLDAPVTTATFPASFLLIFLTPRLGGPSRTDFEGPVMRLPLRSDAGRLTKDANGHSCWRIRPEAAILLARARDVLAAKRSRRVGGRHDDEDDDRAGIRVQQP